MLTSATRSLALLELARVGIIKILDSLWIFFTTGVVLLVDANQGVQAQTVSNFYLAFAHNLELIAAMNKIDLPGADPERVR